MKVLITGGGGFVGSNLADRLLDEGHEVLVIDNYSTGRRDNLREQDGLTIVEDTIADAGAVNRAFETFDPDHVVHAAASYKDPDNWAEDTRTNAEGTVNVVRAAMRADVGRFIYFQTALCYGTQPIEQPITLGHPIRPDSSYAISKTAGEQYIAMSGLNWVSFRLANAYGPRNVSGPLPTFFHRLTEGKPCFVMDTRRDFMYVDDLVDIVVRALHGEGGGAYHVSSGSDFAIKQLFDATVGALGIELDEDVEVRPRNPDDAYTILLDPSRTHEDFPGWRISTPLEQGVQRTVAYYQEHGIEETYTHLRLPERETSEDRA
jgi:UDP-glucose 4-epimerase